jgi:uncharacterized protein Yka (UPF0111/DUF47 family)
MPRISFRWLSDLTGASQRRFVGLLVGQMEATAEGASAVRRAVIGDSSGNLRATMREIEHRGDRQRANLVAELSTALVTPIDREDLFRLSRAIDDVLDHLRDFSREWELYRMESAPIFDPLLSTALDAIQRLRSATEALLDDPAAVGRGALEAKKSGNRVRRLYQEAMAELLNVPDERIGSATLKQRELLRRLDIVGLRIRQAADVLADASVKRSH